MDPAEQVFPTAHEVASATHAMSTVGIASFVRAQAAGVAHEVIVALNFNGSPSPMSSPALMLYVMQLVSPSSAVEQSSFKVP
jgi:hypothetical protein